MIKVTAFCLSTNPFLLMLLCYSIDDMTKVWFAESVCLTSYTSAAKKIGLYMALNFLHIISIVLFLQKQSHYIFTLLY